MESEGVCGEPYRAACRVPWRLGTPGPVEETPRAAGCVGPVPEGLLGTAMGSLWANQVVSVRPCGGGP